MNRTLRLSTAVVLALSASGALAQTTSTTQPFGPGTGGVGVDVWSTLYPRSPQSTITQTQPTSTTT